MIDIRFDIPIEFRKQAITLYYEAFKSKFSKLMSLDESLDILTDLLNNEQTIYAVQDGHLIGFAGIQHGNKRLFKNSLQPFIKRLGIMRGLLVAVVLSLFDRPYKDSELLMDGICVDKNMRGQGVGSLLLEKVYEFAKNNNYKTIRLDVVDTNPRARKLYEKIGFVPTVSHHYPFTKKLMGFSASTTLVRNV